MSKTLFEASIPTNMRIHGLIFGMSALDYGHREYGLSGRVWRHLKARIKLAEFKGPQKGYFLKLLKRIGIFETKL